MTQKNWCGDDTDVVILLVSERGFDDEKIRPLSYVYESGVSCTR